MLNNKSPKSVATATYLPYPLIIYGYPIPNRSFFFNSAGKLGSFFML